MSLLRDSAPWSLCPLLLRLSLAAAQGDHQPVPTDESVEVADSGEEAPAGQGCCAKHFRFDEGKKPNHGDPNRHNHARDTVCCLIFGAFWFVLVIMFMVVWSKGDVKRLYYPTDYTGNLCGINNGTGALRSEGNLANFSKAAFPRLADDIASVMQGSTCDDITECKIELLTVCVTECPKKQDIVCTYKLEEQGLSAAERRALAARGSSDESSTGCWFTPIDTEEYLGRCVPWPERHEKETYVCKEFNDLGELTEVFRGPQMCSGGADPDNFDDPVARACKDKMADFVSNTTRNRLMCEEGVAVASDGSWAETEPCTYTGPECVGPSPTCQPPPGLRKGDCAGELDVSVEIEEVTTGGNDVLMQMLVSYTYMLQQIFEDLHTSLGFVVFCGGFVSMVVGFAFILLLQFLAPIVIWLIVLGIFVLLMVLDAYVFLRAGTFFGFDLSNVTSTIDDFSEELTADMQVSGENLDSYVNLQTTAETVVYWTIGGYVLFALWLVYFVGIFCVCDRIALCITIIRNSSQYIRRVPGILFLPFFTYAAQMASMAFFSFFILLINTCGSFTASDLEEAAHASLTTELCGCDVSSEACMRLCVCDTMSGLTTGSYNGVPCNNTAAGALEADDDTDYITYMFAVALFGFFWTTNLFQAIGTIVMSRAVADNYWHDPETDGELPLSPTITALKGTLLYHTGSAIFGALIVAIINMMRATLQYIGSQTREMQEESRMLKLAFCVCTCALWCFEKVVKYFTRNAYIFVAITGENFVQSAWNAFKTVLHNPVRIAIVQPIAFLVLLLGKAGITAGTTFFCYWYLTTAPEYQVGGESEISDTTVPCVCCGLMAFIVANAFMNSFGVTTDTLLLSFCFDEQLEEEDKDQSYTMYAIRNPFNDGLKDFATDVDGKIEDLGKKGGGKKGDDEKPAESDSAP